MPALAPYAPAHRTAPFDCPCPPARPTTMTRASCSLPFSALHTCSSLPTPTTSPTFYRLHAPAVWTARTWLLHFRHRTLYTLHARAARTRAHYTLPTWWCGRWTVAHAFAALRTTARLPHLPHTALRYLLYAPYCQPARHAHTHTARPPTRTPTLPRLPRTHARTYRCLFLPFTAHTHHATTSHLAMTPPLPCTRYRALRAGLHTHTRRMPAATHALHHTARFATRAPPACHRYLPTATHLYRARAHRHRTRDVP